METETTTQHTLLCFLSVSVWIGDENEAGLQQRKQNRIYDPSKINEISPNCPFYPTLHLPAEAKEKQLHISALSIANDSRQK